MKHVKVELPDQLYRQMEMLVTQGWFRDQEEILNLALRKFLNTNRPEFLERFLHEDVEWGLSGGKK